MTDCTPSKKIAFIGDSYSSGMGLANPSTRWTTRYAAMLGLTEVNLSNGGAGWINHGSAGNFLAQSQNLTADIDTVIICGGINDTSFNLSLTNVINVVETLLANVRAKSPNATIIVLGPMWMDTTPVDSLLLLDARLRIAVTQAGERYIDGAPWIRLRRSDWQLSAGDGHPNVAGHLAIASWVNVNISQRAEGEVRGDFAPIGTAGKPVPGPNPTVLAGGTIYTARPGWWEITGTAPLSGICIGWNFIEMGTFRCITRHDVVQSGYVEVHSMTVRLFWPGGDMPVAFGYWANGASATGALTEGFTRVSARWTGL